MMGGIDICRFDEHKFGEEGICTSFAYERGAVRSIINLEVESL
jgi:hypothetical protein